MCILKYLFNIVFSLQTTDRNVIKKTALVQLFFGEFLSNTCEQLLLDIIIL